MKIALVALLALGAAGAARAVDLNTCDTTEYTAAVSAPSGDWGCFSASVRETDTSGFGVTVPSSAAGKTLLLAVINHRHSRDGGWDPAAFTLGTNARLTVRAPGIDPSVNPQPLGLDFDLMPAASDGTVFGVWRGIDDACAGTYTVTFDEPGGADDTEFMLAFAIVDEGDELYKWFYGTPWLQQNAVSTSGGSTTITKKILLGFFSRSFVVPINAGWSNEGYLAKTVTINVAATDSAYNDEDATWDVAVVARDAGSDARAATFNDAVSPGVFNPSGGNSDPFTTRSGQGAVRTFKGVGPQGQGINLDSYNGAGALVTLPNLNAFDENWSGALYADLTVTITWEEYPAPGAGMLDTRALPNAGDPRDDGDSVDRPLDPPLIQEEIYMTSVSSLLWVKMKATVSGLDTQPTISYGLSTDGARVANIGAPFGLALDEDGVAYNNAIISPLTTWSNDVRVEIPTNNLKLINYVGSPKTPKVFIKVQRGPCSDAQIEWTGVSVSVDYVTGECQSVADCFSPEDDHPSDTSGRVDVSAIGDEDRFVNCMLSYTGVGTPSLAVSTICSECLADCDCPGGYYCHLDAGLCSNANGGVAASPWDLWTCDPWSAQRFGTCQEKVGLGERCRPNQDPYPSGAYYVTDTDLAGDVDLWLGDSDRLTLSIPSTLDDEAVDPTSEDWDPTDDNMNAYGYCGANRYWNASNTYAGADQVAYRARVTLWSGFCKNYQCVECYEYNSGGCQGRTCVDGKFVDRITMDGTPRTYTSNAVAGTLLGLTFMIILLQVIVVANFVYHRCFDHKHHEVGSKNPAFSGGATPAAGPPATA